ncbi:MAG: hypothetical protein IJL69_02495, partial [Oscillospiraceae bacterium]|nr:hypothetical protein [Oscillospiraceae bacterium]
RGEPPERTAARGGGLRLLAVSGAAGSGRLLGFTADSVRLDGREQGRMTVAAAPGLDRGGEEALIGL